MSQDKYTLPKEEKIRNKLSIIDTEIEELLKTKEQVEQELAGESVLKRLLYENGKPLEEAIRVALKILGFTVSHFDNSDSEFDVVFESEEGRLIGEAEGKDNNCIKIDKLRQLEMNIHEDYSREEVEVMAKGALFGNAYRLIIPEERKEIFSAKCFTAAERSGTALISTVDLFNVAKYLSGKTNRSFAQKCRHAIISSTKLVEFPEIPLSKKAVETISETSK
jgi:hypothetical protein